ncbi:transglutaminase [Flavobacterium akiainvivens]|uniref:Transglutaminase n=1 Tax=Flavobacterium akiainvivens TaxID=1202724 RepID=A0A0M8MB00_9FLAO|nr:DUF3857 domain-containing protein [Flavobacterium akiainvivens]KOS06315.1 transglutaminase [Flavobacterium akiainvivens]SFQ16487.1 protein of unknown function [Flavobacterium akiainvivens]
MLKKIISLLVVALAAHTAIAQDYVKPKAPGVTVADLQEQQSPIDSTAAAAYLYRYGNTYYILNGNYWEMVTEVFTRVKIYKKEGYDYANLELDYYSGGRKARGKFENAVTYNYQEGKIVATRAQDESAFEQELNDDYSRRTITLPNVKEGSIIEYSTKITTPYFGHLEDWYFQYDIPAVNVQYDIRIPIYFIYNVYLVGYVDVKSAEKPRLLLNTTTDTNEFFYTYKAANVKPFKDEAYVSNKENFIGKLQHELCKVQLPHQTIQNYATNWEDTSRKIFGRDAFGRELKQDSYFKDDLEALLAGIQGDEAKMQVVFKYVQNRMVWDKRHGYICEKGVKEAYKQKLGNVGDINLMLTAMLREAGLDANPVVVSTREHGVAQFPSMYSYNYVISSVKLADKTILLDATSKYTSPGILPTRALNWKGRLIKKNGDNEEIDLMPKTNSRKAITIVGTVSADGTLTGKARDHYLQQRGYGYREAYAEMNIDDYLAEFEGEYPGLEVSDYKMTGQDEPDKPLVEEYAFVHKNVAEIIGDKIYISPMLFFTEKESPFKAEKREYPVDFIYPREDRYALSITIPDGYTVASLPKALNIGMQENLGSFKYILAQNGNVVQVSAVITINYASISADYYTVLKDFYSKMIEKQNEKIVLIKA